MQTVDPHKVNDNEQDSYRPADVVVNGVLFLVHTPCSLHALFRFQVSF